MSSVSFNQRHMQIHVAEPGATALISGTWDGSPGSQFSLRGVTASGHWDALDATWRIAAPAPGEPAAKGTWDATVRFYRTGMIDLTVRLVPPIAAEDAEDTAQAEVTMDRAIPDLLVLEPVPAQELTVEPEGASIPLRAQSRSDLGPRTVSWEMQKASHGSADNDPETDLWTGTVEVAPAPLGLQPLAVTVRCDEAPDVTGSVAVPLTLVESAAGEPVVVPPKAMALALGPGDPRPSAEERTAQALVYGLPPGGGGSIPNCGPDVKPAVGLEPLKGPVIPGHQVTISGWSDPGEVWFWNAGDNSCDSMAMVRFSGVTITLDDGQQFAATGTDSFWSGFSATVTFPQGGTHTATAHATTTSGATYSATISVLVAPTPTLTVTAPATGASVGVGALGGSVQVTAVTADGTAFGGFAVTAQPDIGNAVALTLAAGGTTQWTGTVVFGPMPLGARSMTVTCAYVVAPALTTTVSVPLKAVDTEAPELIEVTDPPPSGTVVVDATRTVHLKGIARDANSGMAGGSAQVTVALSLAGPQIPATPVNPGDYSAWTATVTVPGYGAQTLYVWATDAAGNKVTAPLQSPFEAISSYLPATLDDRLSDLEYLLALTQFARDQVTAGTAGAVSSTMLAAALGQPLDVIAAEVPGTPTVTAAEASINELRIPAESLRAYIAAHNVPAAPGAAGEAAYLSTAYQTLLSGVGTTYTELRLARGAGDPARQALAARLGITLYGASSGQPRPDQLDALTLDGTGLTEAALETLFGLPATTAGLDPFRTIQPQLLSWQISAQQTRWQSQDQSPPASVAYTVIVDPDIITAADLVPGTQQFTHVSSLLQTRVQQLAGQASSLTGLVTGSGSNTAELAALLASGLPGTDIASLRAKDLQGADISAELAAAGLDRAGFAYLLQLQALAATGLVSNAEWSTAVDVLIGAFRRRQYPTWATQETGMVLSPDIFQLTDAGPTVSSYRIDPRARADWKAALLARTVERQALIDGMNGLVATAEQASRGILRDALLLDVATAQYGQNPAQQAIDATATQLALRYQVDFAARGSLSTTRLAQATASLQSLLELIRSGDNTSATGSVISGWSLTNGEATFDAAWAWMGTAGSWRSAATTFLFAEAALDPALLQKFQLGPSSPSAAYQALCQALAVIGPPDAITPDPIAAYQTSVTGLLRTLGLLGPSAALTYLSGRSLSHQSTLAGWCVSLNAGQPDLALEIFWAAPMLIGERLHAAGQYQAALDWLWVALPYNSTSPVSSYSLINTELATPAANAYPANLTFAPNWTADLNPFHLVQGGGPGHPYRPYTWIRNTLLAIISCLADYADSEFSAATDESLGHARNLYSAAAGLLAHPSLVPVKPSNPGEPALPIPQLGTLTTRVTTQLAKLRQGRDIAGLPRTQVITSGNPISQPTPYHFKVLLARAQQLTQQAATIESEYLSALEKYDAKTLQLSDAQNAANVANLQLNVSSDQVQAATDAITAAVAQQTKATTMSSQYSDAINAPPNQYEQDLLSNYGQMRDAQDAIAGVDAAIGVAQATITGMSTPWGALAGAIAGTALYGTKAGLQMWANNLQAQAQADQLQAGIENRKQEWQIQKAAADQDALVAAAQVTTATDQKTIATDEQTVAIAQSNHAAATLQMLTTQFTNPDLYKWMSDTLGGVYRYFLQQATATARLAQAQLAFERAEPPQAFVRTSYWQPPAQLAAPASTGTNGMTGAERLAEDLSQLDQYAFSTDTRRLNLSQTFSLAQLMPADFLAFTSTGQISFATPMQWFDQDFPGHYQRLIRQVSVSVVALVPPTRGIRATLSSSGISNVIAANNGSFSEVLLRRDPTTIGFTAPMNATGVFATDLQPDLLLPFEGSGVDTTWEFSMLPAANPFDFAGVSDVLIAIDYTALADPGYRDQVIRQLNANVSRSSDCVFSFARDFPDQWYALNNPGSTGRETTLTLGNADFPPGISPASLATTQVAIRLAAGGTLASVPVTLSHGAVAGTATTDAGGVASTRRGASGWNPLTGTSPTGDWTLSFDASADHLFQQGLLTDVLLIISWAGLAPTWPLATRRDS